MRLHGAGYLGAWTILDENFLEGTPAQEAYGKAREAADRALTLSPDLAAAHALPEVISLRSPTSTGVELKRNFAVRSRWHQTTSRRSSILGDSSRLSARWSRRSSSHGKP